LPLVSTEAAQRPLARAEWACLLGLVVLLVAASIAPAVQQPSAYHALADVRSWRVVPNAANVLSNLAFVICGGAIVVGLTRPAGRALGGVTRTSLVITAAGVLFTAWGSAHYHWQPDDATLFWDRLPMTLAFAGVTGIVLAQRVSLRAARVAVPLLLLLGPASVVYWRQSGNVLPYALVQVGLMVGLMLIVVSIRRRDDPFPWAWLIAGYAAAKLGETFDAVIFDATGRVVSGHTLKHLLAAAAVGALAWPLFRRRFGPAGPTR